MELFITNSNTRVFNVDIACAIGLKEAIVLQQIQYWIDIKKKTPKNYKDSFHDGYWWVFNTYAEWQEQFPFLCLRTIKTIFKHLETEGYIIVGNYNKIGYDRTRWYRINYDKLEKSVKKYQESKEIQESAKLAPSEVQNLHYPLGQICTNNTKDYTDTTNKEYFIKGNSCAEFDVSIFKKQLIKCYEELGKPYEENKEEIDLTFEVMTVFFGEYKYRLNKPHPIISNQALIELIGRYHEIDSVIGWEYMYIDAIEGYFNTDFDCDRNIFHFMTLEIVIHRCQEYGYITSVDY